MADDLETRRKRIAFRAWRRAFREADLMVGRFAEKRLSQLTPLQVESLEALLEESDADLYAWITGAKPVPAEHDTDVMAMLQDIDSYMPRRD